MKALSLTQPFATLMAVGAKRIETRSWSTSWRGLLAIHASKSFPVEYRDVCGEPPFRLALEAAGYRDPLEGGLPCGAILAVVHLQRCIRTPWANEARVDYGPGSIPPAEPERSFGNYEPGRFAWICAEVRRLPEPVPCRGSLGLWEVPGEIVARIEAQWQ